jgi:excisionase family DNA binding protein
MLDAVPKLLTITELAEKLRVSPHTIRSWMRRGRINPTRICRRLLFHPSECVRFLAAHSKVVQDEETPPHV